MGHRLITHSFSTFSHKKCSIADLKPSAVAGELIYIDTRLGSSYNKIHLVSLLGNLRILVPRAQLQVETSNFKWHLYFMFKYLIPKGNKGRHHTCVTFGNVSKTRDHQELSWSFHNLLFNSNPKCNYVFGIFLFCFDYNWYTMNKISNFFVFWFFFYSHMY